MNVSESEYKRALSFLEECRYEDAVKHFINAYYGGGREDSLEALYQCFVFPNEEEFRSNCSMAREISPDYDTLLLDFIPISDTRFYIYDKEEEQFLGVIDYDDFSDRSKEQSFHSLIVTELWDWREFATVWKDRVWRRMFAVIEKERERFYSFYKLPKFGEIVRERMTVFETCSEMADFFENNDAEYLPKASYGSVG